MSIGLVLKLQGNIKKHSKTGGFYASKSEVTTDGIVQSFPQEYNKSQASVMCLGTTIKWSELHEEVEVFFGYEESLCPWSSDETI